MVTAGSKNHCQPSSAISAGCCANMSPVASQTTPTRAIAKPSMQVSLAGPDVTSFDSIESNDDRPAPIASKLHEIGRHTLFQVFLS